MRPARRQACDARIRSARFGKVQPLWLVTHAFSIRKSTRFERCDCISGPTEPGRRLRIRWKPRSVSSGGTPPAFEQMVVHLVSDSFGRYPCGVYLDLGDAVLETVQDPQLNAGRHRGHNRAGDAAVSLERPQHGRRGRMEEPSPRTRSATNSCVRRGYNSFRMERSKRSSGCESFVPTLSPAREAKSISCKVTPE
jgi:hypothetical protein